MNKTVFAAALAFTLFASSLHAQDAISGKWNATVAGPQGDMGMSFTLAAGAAGALTGSMSMTPPPGVALPQGMTMPEFPISDGKVTGKEVSFKIVMPTPPGAPAPMTLKVTGKLEGDSLTLTPSMDGAPAGGPAPQALVAKRVAPAK